MDEPPRDASGNVIPYNDLDVLDDDGLIRRISPEHMVNDKNTGEFRPSTAAFSESSIPNGGMSVDLERLMADDGLDRLAMLPSRDFGAVRLIAGDMRQLGHKVGRDPLPSNPYHGEVWNIGSGRAARKRIMEKMVWLKRPSQAPQEQPNS